MTEGEIKKRIRKVIISMGNYEGSDVAPADIFSVIDEAAKEFPCYPKCSYLDIDTKTEELGKTEFAPCESCYLWRVWFLKWFGAPEKEKTQ